MIEVFCGAFKLWSFLIHEMIHLSLCFTANHVTNSHVAPVASYSVIIKWMTILNV